MSEIEVNNIAHKLLETRTTIKELEEEEKALIELLESVMIEQGVETLYGDDWKADWTNVTSERFDSKAFKKDHFDLYKEYARKSVTTRFTIR